MMISYVKRVHIVFPCSQHSNTQSRQEFISCFAGGQIIEYSLPICNAGFHERIFASTVRLHNEEETLFWSIRARGAKLQICPCFF